MIEKKENQKVEEIVNSYENAMKKGFINSLILLVLEQENCHGYLIKERIDELTLSVWQPSVSSLYPLLKSLTDKKLIKCIERDDSGGRLKKIYQITPKGRETLKMLIQKYNLMIESIKSIVLSTLGITDESNPSFVEDLEKIISMPHMNLLKERTYEGKIDVLKYNKKLIQQRIKIMNNNLEKINTILLKLEGDLENGKISEVSSY